MYLIPRYNHFMSNTAAAWEHRYRVYIGRGGHRLEHRQWGGVEPHQGPSL